MVEQIYSLCFFHLFILKIAPDELTTMRTTDLTKQRIIFHLLSSQLDSHKCDLFFIVKLKKFKNMGKIWIANTYEINIAKKIITLQWKISIAKNIAVFKNFSLKTRHKLNKHLP